MSLNEVKPLRRMKMFEIKINKKAHPYYQHLCKVNRKKTRDKLKTKLLKGNS